jgi:hypothetical protein
MGLGIHKRDRIARRADRWWRSVWHQQMLQQPRSSRWLDIQVEVWSSDGVAADGGTDNPTVGSSDTKHGE